MKQIAMTNCTWGWPLSEEELRCWEKIISETRAKLDALRGERG